MELHIIPQKPAQSTATSPGGAINCPRSKRGQRAAAALLLVGWSSPVCSWCWQQNWFPFKCVKRLKWCFSTKLVSELINKSIWIPFTGWPCVVHRPPAGRRVLLGQQPRPAGQVCPRRSDHLLPPQPWTSGAGCHRRALGERVLRTGQPTVGGRGAERAGPAPHPVAYLLQPVARLPPDWRVGKGGGAGQPGAGAPGRHHLQLYAGLPEGEAVPGPAGRAHHMHRQRDGRRDFLYIGREV